MTLLESGQKKSQNNMEQNRTSWKLPIFARWTKSQLPTENQNLRPVSWIFVFHTKYDNALRNLSNCGSKSVDKTCIPRTWTHFRHLDWWMHTWRHQLFVHNFFLCGHQKKSVKVDICVLLDLHQKITSSIWLFCSSKLTFLLNWKFWDDLVQSRSNLRDQHLENLENPSHKLADREDSNSSQESTISTAFDPQHGIRRKIRTSSDLGFESYLLT